MQGTDVYYYSDMASQRSRWGPPPMAPTMAIAPQWLQARTLDKQAFHNSTRALRGHRSRVQWNQPRLFPVSTQAEVAVRDQAGLPLPARTL